jgi:hypothetical protein
MCLRSVIGAKASQKNLHFYKRNRTPSREGRYDLTERNLYAVDNICDLAGALAAWLHRSFWWRAHSFVARYRCDRAHH